MSEQAGGAVRNSIAKLVDGTRCLCDDELLDERDERGHHFPHTVASTGPARARFTKLHRAKAYDRVRCTTTHVRSLSLGQR